MSNASTIPEEEPYADFLERLENEQNKQNTIFWRNLSINLKDELINELIKDRDVKNAIRVYCDQFIGGDPGSNAVAEGVLRILDDDASRARE